MKLNREELAWAAGFFDGEGSVGIYLGGGPTHKPTYRRLMLSITQTDLEILKRFQRAVLGLGNITGGVPPKSAFKAKPQWVFRTGSFEQVQAIIAILWEFLSSVKRDQAKHTLTNYAIYWQGRKLPSN